MVQEEHVYVLHQYTAEFEDELPLRIGERITVIEKDEGHGDSWWTGRNSAGRVGLFPQNYTSPESPFDLFSDESSAAVPTGGEPTARRFTDLCAAIDQEISKPVLLSRPCSISSSFDLSESESEVSEDEGRFKKARARLAERARLQLEEARARERDFSLHIRLPTISTGTSSESGSDDDDIDTLALILRQRLGDDQASTVPATAKQASFMSEGIARTTSPEPIPSDGRRRASPLDRPAVSPVSPSLSSTGLNSKTNLAPSAPSLSSRTGTFTETAGRASVLVGLSASKLGKVDDPNTWSVSEVIEWLKLRNFDDNICEKFREHEVSGDVLLALDERVLEMELDIPVPSVRLQVLAAITNLLSQKNSSRFEEQSPATAFSSKPISTAYTTPVAGAGVRPASSPTVGSAQRIPPSALPDANPLRSSNALQSPSSGSKVILPVRKPIPLSPDRVPVVPADRSSLVSAVPSPSAARPSISSPAMPAVLSPAPHTWRSSHTPASTTAISSTKLLLLNSSQPPAPPTRRPSTARRTGARLPDVQSAAAKMLTPAWPIPVLAIPNQYHATDNRRSMQPAPPLRRVEEPFQHHRTPSHPTALIAAATFLPPGAARPTVPGGQPPRPLPFFYQDVLLAAHGPALRPVSASALPAPVFRAPAPLSGMPRTSSKHAHAIPPALMPGRSPPATRVGARR